MHTTRSPVSLPLRGAALLASAALAAGGLVTVTTSSASAADPAPGADVTVNVRQGLGTIPEEATGMNAAVWDSYMNSDAVPGLMEEAGVDVMRYPGGSYSDIYHWETHTAPGGFVAPGTGFDSFMSTVQEAGAQAMVTANYGSGSPEESAGWVEYANVTNDYDVTYWEIGNEIYGNGYYGSQWENDEHADKSATAYANNLLAHAEAMRAVDPSIEIGAVLTTPGNWPDGVIGSNEDTDWNDTVLSIAGDAIDFGIVHWYPGGSSPSEMLAKPQRIPDIMAQVRGTIAEHVTNPDDVRIAVTETNSEMAMNTHPTALFAPDMYMQWLESGVFNVDWWNLHNGASEISTVGGVTDYGDYGILSNASCVDEVCEPAANTPFGPYYGIKMLDTLGGPGDMMVGSASSEPLVSTHAVRQADGDLAVMLVNKDPDAAYTANLSYAGFAPASGSATVHTYRENADAITTRQHDDPASLTVPAYSVTTIEVDGDPVAGPGVPGQPTVSDTTHDSATVSWSPPSGGDQVDKYEVYRHQGANMELLGSSTGTSLQVGNLEPGTRYTFTVLARDGAGHLSPPSAPVTLTTGTPQDSTCAADFEYTAGWGSGFNATITVTNRNDAPMSGWTLGFEFPTGYQQVSGGWNGTWDQSGTHVNVSGLDRTIPAGGGSVTVGFTGANDGPSPEPEVFTLNGKVCTTQ